MNQINRSKNEEEWWCSCDSGS